MEKCKACGGELAYDELRNVCKCVNCGARFAVTGDMMLNQKTKDAKFSPQQKKISIKVRKQIRYFTLYYKLPQIVFGIICAISCVIGIIFACFIGGGEGALYWFISMLCGAVAAGICYFILRIACSHKLLQIHYLQKIAGEDKGILDY